MDDKDYLLDVLEAARLLNVGARFVRRLIADRRIEYTKVGKFVRVLHSEITNYVEKQTILPLDASPSSRYRKEQLGRTDSLLNADQAAQLLNVKNRFVRRIVTERRIAYVKVGKFVRLRRSHLDDFVERATVPRDD